MLQNRYRLITLIVPLMQVISIKYEDNYGKNSCLFIQICLKNITWNSQILEALCIHVPPLLHHHSVYHIATDSSFFMEKLVPFTAEKGCSL